MVDPRLKNHRFMLGLAFAGSIIGFLYAWFINGSDFINSLWLAVAIGIGAFLSWAISRELDPDHPNSALLGPLLIIPALLVSNSYSILLGFVMITLLRVVTRSTGLPSRPLDSTGLLLVSGWLGYSLHPLIAVLIGVGLVADSRLSAGHGYHGYLGAGVLLAGMVYWLLAGVRLQLAGLPLLLGTGAAGLLWLLAITLLPKPAASLDFTAGTISPHRVKIAQLLALLSALAPLLILGEVGFTAQLPLWSSLIGIALYIIADRAKRSFGFLSDSRVKSVNCGMEEAGDEASGSHGQHL